MTDVQDANARGAPPAHDTAEAVKDEAGSTASTAVEQSRETASAAAEGTRQVASEAAQQATRVTREATDQAREVLQRTQSELREQATSQTERTAAGLRDLGQQFSGLAEGRSDGGFAADAARQLGEGVTGFAQRLEERGFDGTVEDLRQFATRRPGLFLLGAAAAGFVTVRLGRGLQAVDD